MEQDNTIPTTQNPSLTRRNFVAGSMVTASMLCTGAGRPQASANGLESSAEGAGWTGPIVGHVDESSALIWSRPPAAGRYRLVARLKNSSEVITAEAEALEEHDFCLVWRLKGLTAGMTYEYKPVDYPGDDTRTMSFRTATARGEPSRTVLTFGSCATEDFPGVWQRIADCKPEVMVLGGDTPYIDSSDLAHNRKRHREFLAYPPIAALGRNISFMGTWDDHDFGGNDTDGRVHNKASIRRAFTEYRAQKAFGEKGHGIYTRFRRGPVEVFLIDARYFSQTEPSPFNKEKPTLLGESQWTWLQEVLRNSDATFKVLTTGLIWNDKGNREKDDWFTYQHELDALKKFIGTHRIPGVILMAGDIHVSRCLRHRWADIVGYDVYQCIVSPLHNRIIPTLNPPHDELLFGKPEPNVFLKMVADDTVTPATLSMTWINMAGEEIYNLDLDADKLTPQ